MGGVQNLSTQLEEIVEQFEMARYGSQDADLTQFLPKRNHPQYHQILTELIRADMEFSWDDGDPRRLEWYINRFPEDLHDTSVLSDLAFEEYRLRFRQGESVAPSEYSAKFGLNTNDWPIWSRHDQPGVAATSSVELGYSNEGYSDRGFAPHDERIELPATHSTFGTFELVGELGSGAFSKVYLARQPALANRFVALKVTATPLGEPQRLAQLQHTNIVPIFSTHREGDLHGICMPFLGAATVADVLQGFDSRDDLPQSGQWFLSTLAARRASTLVSCDLVRESSEGDGKGVPQDARTLEHLGQMSYQDAVVWLVSRVADGLAHAHEHGVIHRDLKPANILLSDDGEPLILDFNLSTSSELGRASHSLVGGTLPYMSIEHIASLRTNAPVDARADIFSIGVVLFELLTGKLPFPERKGPLEEVTEQMIQDRRTPPDSVLRACPTVSADVESIVLHCLSADPDRRYQSARELQTDLRRQLDQLPLVFAPNRSLVERTRKWVRRHPRLTSGTTVMLGALVVCAALITSYSVQARRLTRVSAQQTANQTLEQLEVTKKALSDVWVDFGSLDETISQAAEVLKREQVDQFADALHREDFRFLDEKTKLRLRERIGTIQYLLAAATSRQASRTQNVDQRLLLLESSLQQNRLAESTFTKQQRPKALYLQRSRTLDELGDSDQSAAAREQAAAIPVRSIEDRALLAHEHMLNSEFLEAAQLLKQDEIALSMDYASWFILGNALTRLGRFDDADRAFTVCLAADPHSSGVFFHRGTVRLHQQRFSESLTDFNRAIAQGTRCTSAYVNRALVHKHLNDLEAAERDLTQAIQQGATETRIFFIRSRVRRLLGNEKGARVDFEEGLQRVPSDELSWISRGVAKLPHIPGEALGDFEAALKINPRSWQAMQNLADTLGNQPSDLEKAIAMLDRLIKLQPTVPQWVASRGVFLARLGRDEDALHDAQTALRLRRDADILYRVAGIYALASLRKPEHAEVAMQFLSEAAWKNPSLVRGYIHSDPDLKPLAPTDDFVTLVQRLDQLRAGATQ